VAATSLKVGPTGVKLDLLGLKAILLGGVAFDVFGKPGAAVADDTEFTLCADQTAARATGDPVRISFRNGQGIVAGQTEVRRLGLPVGYVETAVLNEANQTVDTVVRFQPAFEHLHPAGTVFTLIRPRISLDGVSGLETVVTGPYLECVPGPAGPSSDHFEGRTFSDDGLMTAQAERAGLRVTLQAEALPALGDGAPVLYRGLVAGRVKRKTLDAHGNPELELVIRQEYAPVVARNARFWPVPGAAVQAGPGILNVDVAGLQTLVKGAVAFDVFGTPEAAAEDGAKFPRKPPRARFPRRFASRSRTGRVCSRGKPRSAISASPSAWWRPSAQGMARSRRSPGSRRAMISCGARARPFRSCG
jgi:paraquat-inducible protein B